MTINTQFVNMSRSIALEEYTQHKLKKLYQKYDWIIKTDVFFKKENDPSDKGQICIMEVSIPGPKIAASSNEKHYEMAVKETVNDLEKQLQKRKALMKRTSLI